MSSANVLVGVDDEFRDSDKEVVYHNIKLNPQSFMDDILRPAENVRNAQYGNDKMEEMVKKKVLKFNLDKSNFVILGNKKSRKKLRDEEERNPLLLCGQKMKEVKSIKFLGDVITHNLEESVHETVQRRITVAKHTIAEPQPPLYLPRRLVVGIIIDSPTTTRLSLSHAIGI